MAAHIPSTVIPVLDFSLSTEQLTVAMRAACEDVGFFYLGMTRAHLELTSCCSWFVTQLTRK